MANSTVGALLWRGDFATLDFIRTTWATVGNAVRFPGPQREPFARGPYVDNYSGLYKVEGVAKDGTTVLPLACRVLLAPAGSPALIIASADTDAETGTFSFTYLAAGKYAVLGVDMTGVRNDAVYAWIDAVPM